MSHPPGCQCGDDDAHVILAGVQDSLFDKVDRERVVALNATAEGKVVIKPWDRRGEDEPALESDADEELILQVPFTGSVKLRSILLRAGPGDQTPSELKVFVNSALDFDGAGSTEPTQVFEIPQTSELVELPVRPAKFPSVQSLTLYFPASHGADSTRLSFVGFKGEFTPLNKNPVISVYELAANPADHPKIKGLDGAQSRLG